MFNKIIIFAIHRERGTEFLDNLVGEIKHKDINKIRKNLNEYIVELKDGTTYQIVSASDSARGYKCNKAYVENGTDKEILDCVIRPTLVMSTLSNSEQIEYF
jgi:hypothetical protein